jgi:type II restriction enzyme
VLTEDWAAKHLFCASCKQNRLSRAHDNTRVIDYVCDTCKETYQLKSQGKSLGDKVLDSAYEPMVNSIKQNMAPNLLLLHYNRFDYCAENLIIVPRYFLTLSCIEPRKPLSASARRAGWVGCNIVLREIPVDGKIPIIKEKSPVSPKSVREHFGRFRFLLGKKYDLRGWTADVLKTIRELGKPVFSLDEIYAFEEHLARLHPENRHIRPKIRQQLQLLRDKGILAFHGKGSYSVVG